MNYSVKLKTTLQKSSMTPIRLLLVSVEYNVFLKTLSARSTSRDPASRTQPIVAGFSVGALKSGGKNSQTRVVQSSRFLNLKAATVRPRTRNTAIQITSR